MIRHVVAFKLADTDPAVRAVQAAEAARRLTALVGVVPSLRAMSAGANALDLPGNWELVLVADFDDAAGLDAYQVHPAHEEVAAFIGGIRSDRVAVDFEV
ncbi:MULTISPECIES: Dabb family protein [unclassified Microbacterium]|uniref:Dabb family protein n=1 Tax=unclassified Microbacterium TaxID=2609290 RepID=UPI00214B551A|nr:MULTISPECIES: Dabb family protein [unclassified Microbacterium]MCR2799914.1 Dabb family protein [Microbacterium sp. zg.Y818]MCR2825168.1 Dabb family protein [Microbacterium sp. zg.Y909]MCR2826232.1 Dabb family protein [Microbacterium sp. zg.Y909]WIM21896.1 Dabb family protein [Microbacterium sp. zg-Y818]